MLCFCCGCGDVPSCFWSLKSWSSRGFVFVHRGALEATPRAASPQPTTSGSFPPSPGNPSTFSRCTSTLTKAGILLLLPRLLPLQGVKKLRSRAQGRSCLLRCPSYLSHLLKNRTEPREPQDALWWTGEENWLSTAARWVSAGELVCVYDTIRRTFFFQWLDI